MSLKQSVFEGKYQDNGESMSGMWNRMAKEFARVRHKKDDSKSEKNWYSHFYRLMENYKYIIPQGSVMSSLGTPTIASLSNCFVIGQPRDSYGGILQKDQELVQLMKRRGGVGLDISTLRPRGFKVTNSAKTSTGAASFMERFSNSTREVAQEGRKQICAIV